MAHLRHSKIADGLPLSGEERSCSGHQRDDRVTRCCHARLQISAAQKNRAPFRGLQIPVFMGLGLSRMGRQCDGATLLQELLDQRWLDRWQRAHNHRRC
jgi:hypothetical protein